jgi:hypothetical protein
MSPNTERKYREALKVEGLLFGCKELPDLETLRLAVESQVERSSPPEQWRPFLLSASMQPVSAHVSTETIRTLESETF